MLNGCHLLSELRRMHDNSILIRFFLKISFHCILSFTFVTFLIHWPLPPAASSDTWCQSCFICSELTYEIYSMGGPSRCVYCVVCYRLTTAPNVKSVTKSLCTIILLMMVQNPEWTMSSVLSKHTWRPIVFGQPCLN